MSDYRHLEGIPLDPHFSTGGEEVTTEEKLTTVKLEELNIETHDLTGGPTEDELKRALLGLEHDATEGLELIFYIHADPPYGEIYINKLLGLYTREGGSKWIFEGMGDLGGLPAKWTGHYYPSVVGRFKGSITVAYAGELPPAHGYM